MNRKRKANSSASTPSKPASQPKQANPTEVDELKSQLENKVELLTNTNRQLKRKIFDLYTIFEISRNFNAVLNYESLLDTFIFTCLGQVGALKGAIFLRQTRQSDSFLMAKHKGSGDFPSADQCFPTDSKLAEYLTGLNRPVPTRNLMTETATAQEMEILKNFAPGIIVPLIYQTRLSGIFVMSEKMSGQEFQMDDLEFLSILSNQIAVAIENARLYEGERDATNQLRTAQQQLIQSEKLAALGEMSAKIAHEVNNPLAIIKNYMLLLERACQKDDTAAHQVRIVSEEIDRIVRIVRQLLRFHRPSGVAFEEISICQLIDSVLLLWESHLDASNIEIVRSLSDSCPRIMGSAESLRQVFLNLIINARDVMPDGGRLEICVCQQESNVCVQVMDTGPGIKPELIDKIFEPFFSTKKEGQGTGLGLSVCYGIIKSHKGSITFKNLNPGGCLEILLPAVESG